MSSKKSKKSTPIVFRHYNIPDNPEGSFRAKCKHYGTTISGSSKPTSKGSATNKYSIRDLESLGFSLKVPDSNQRFQDSSKISSWISSNII